MAKKIFLGWVLSILCLNLQAQSIEIAWEGEPLDASKSLSSQDIIEDDEITIVLKPDANLKKQYPQAQKIELISFEATHVKDQKPMGSVSVSDSDKLPLKPFKIIKGEKLIVKFYKAFVIDENGKKTLHNFQNKTLTLIF